MSFARKPGKMEFKKYFLVSVSKNLKQSKKSCAVIWLQTCVIVSFSDIKKHPYDPNTIL